MTIRSLTLISVLLLGSAGWQVASGKPARPVYVTKTAKLPWPVVKRGGQVYEVTVKALQYLLRNAGYTGVKVDGKYGLQTEKAVIAFQRKQGLRADGVVGAVTWSRLVRPVKTGSRGDAVRAVQVRLGLKEDGIFGSKTEAAVRELQDQTNELYIEKKIDWITVDGIVGPVTWNALLAEVGD